MNINAAFKHIEGFTDMTTDRNILNDQHCHWVEQWDYVCVNYFFNLICSMNIEHTGVIGELYRLYLFSIGLGILVSINLLDINVHLCAGRKKSSCCEPKYLIRAMQ